MKHKEPAGRSGYYPHGHYAGSPNRRQKKPLRKPLFYALIAACACVFATSAVLLIRYYADIASSRNASAQLSEHLPVGAGILPGHGRPFSRTIGHSEPRLRPPPRAPLAPASSPVPAAVHGVVRSCFPPLPARTT